MHTILLVLLLTIDKSIVKLMLLICDFPELWILIDIFFISQHAPTNRSVHVFRRKLYFSLSFNSKHITKYGSKLALLPLIHFDILFDCWWRVSSCQLLHSTNFFWQIEIVLVRINIMLQCKLYYVAKQKLKSFTGSVTSIHRRG